VIAWINGTFGVGKTTVAKLIHDQVPKWRLFDPEWVGYMLKANLSDLKVADFQNLRPWRVLVPLVAEQVILLTGDKLLAVQTVLVEDYWDELMHGFAEHQLEVFHVVLDADEQILRERIAGDEEVRQLIAAGKIEPGGEQWRVDHVSNYVAARTWMTTRADLVVDTSGLAANEVAGRILAALEQVGL
jgi:cytidylate kinase